MTSRTGAVEPGYAPPLDYDYAIERITSFIREKVGEAGVKGLVLGLSGGVDSSVTAYLAVRALGPEKVTALIMPDSRTTPKEDVDDALEVARRLGVRHYLVPIDSVYDSFTASIPIFDREARVANGNLRARIRMAILYYFANRLGLMVCGTSDKSEILLGYYTKYGDGGVDILPMGDVYKTQVRVLGRILGVPSRIVTKPSSPRLWPGQMAESELGMSYEEIDAILYHYVDLRLPVDEVVARTRLDRAKVVAIVRRVHSNEHKRLPPPVPKLTSNTVGLDWRMPWSVEGH